MKPKRLFFGAMYKASGVLKVPEVYLFRTREEQTEYIRADIVEDLAFSILNKVNNRVLPLKYEYQSEELDKVEGEFKAALKELER